MDDDEIDRLVKNHLKATSALDIDMTMEAFSDDVEFSFLLTDNVVKGRENLRPLLQKMLFDPVTKLKTEMVQEIRFKNFRTYIERVTECSNPDFVGLDFHWTLEFADGKIKRVWALQ